MERYIAKRRTGWKFILVLVFTILLVILGYELWCMYTQIPVEPPSSVVQAQRTVQTVEPSVQTATDISSILEQVTSSVVGISKLRDTGSTIFLPNGSTELGLGTGVLISADGYILSNAHVTGDSLTSCYVTLENGQNYSAKVVWADTDLDLSLCKIAATDLPFCSLGDSSSVKLGQTVYAIGNPIGFEFQRTVTAGIISAVDRSIQFEENGSISYMDDLLQTDATINPGNSGGPLINLQGEVIGINTVKITSAEGIGFAVPIHSIRPVIDSFVSTGKFTEASLGVFAYDKKVIPYLDTSAKFETGIYVADVTLHSAAEKAGVRTGDIILRVDDVVLQRMCDLRHLIYTKSPGDVISLTILRNKKEQVLEVQLERKY